MKFFIKDFSSKCEQIRSFLRIWSHLLETSLMKNFIFLCIVRSGVFIANLELPLHSTMVFLLLTLNKCLLGKSYLLEPK